MSTYKSILKSRDITHRKLDGLYKHRYDDVGFKKSMEIADDLEKLKDIYKFKNNLLKAISKG